MSTPPVKETRRPELHLPEIKRDEIVRALSEIKLPDIDLSKIDFSKLDFSKLERPNIQRPDIELPKMDLSKVDLRRTIEDVAVRAGVRERTRSRWPLLIGLIAAVGVGIWALLRRPAVRRQVEESAQKARARIEQMRAEREAREHAIDDIAIPVADDSSNGSASPVAVGPGAKGRRAKGKTIEVAEVVDAFEAAGATPNEYEEGLSPTQDFLAAAEDGTLAFEQAKS